MKDDQYNFLVEVLYDISNMVRESSENIIDKISDIYNEENNGIEKRLDIIIDTLIDINEKGEE